MEFKVLGFIYPHPETASSRREAFLAFALLSAEQPVLRGSVEGLQAQG